VNTVGLLVNAMSFALHLAQRDERKRPWPVKQGLCLFKRRIYGP
jgi:hypothetical protein